MPVSSFSAPVHVALGRAGNVIRVVQSPERAAEVLLHEWPARITRKHVAAREAVLRALENAHDRRLTEEARKSFAEAAVDAGILHTPRTKPAVEDARPGSGVWRRRRKQKRDR